MKPLPLTAVSREVLCPRRLALLLLLLASLDGYFLHAQSWSRSLGVTNSSDLLKVDPKLTVVVESGGGVSQSAAGNTVAYVTTPEQRAVPQPGFAFIGWSGDIVDISPKVTVTMTENRRILARSSLVPGNVKFAVRLGQGNFYDIGTPAIGLDGSVYRVYGRNLYVVDGQTGQVRWTYEAPESFPYGPEPVIQDDGSILVVTSTNTVCLDPDTHDVRWRFPASIRIGLGELVYTWQGPELRDHRFRYYLVALDPASGSVIWRGAESNTPDDPLLANGELFLGQSFHYQAMTGTLLRAREPNERSANAIGRNGMIIGWGSHNGVVALHPQSGNVKWRASSVTQYGQGSPPIIGPDDTVYAGTDEGRFFALDGVTGGTRWTARLTPPVRYAAALAADGALYVANGTNFSALDATDGSLRWQTSLTNAFGKADGVIMTAPTIGPDGTVYVGTDYGLVAFVGTAPLAQCPWPKHRADLRNTGRRADFSPQVVLQPQPWMFAEGEEALLRVEFVSQPPPIIQWFFGDQPVTAGTNSSLQLPNFSASQAGLYHAVISNTLGVVTTTPARLFHADLARLDFLGIRVTQNQPGSARIESSPRANGTWSLLEEVTFPAGDSLWLDQSGMTVSARFYRLTSSAVFDARLAQLSGVTINAPIGSQRTVEFVDRGTGWENWQVLTNVTLPESPWIFIDPTPNPPLPRFYRISPND